MHEMYVLTSQQADQIMSIEMVSMFCRLKDAAVATVQVMSNGQSASKSNSLSASSFTSTFCWDDQNHIQLLPIQYESSYVTAFSIKTM